MFDSGSEHPCMTLDSDLIGQSTCFFADTIKAMMPAPRVVMRLNDE